jgi:hypothetical protein
MIARGRALAHLAGSIMFTRPIDRVLLAILMAGCLTGSRPKAGPPAPQTPAPEDDWIADVRRLERDTNEERFDALSSMLSGRGVRFEVQPFTTERGGREPRTEGRNIVVTAGAGARAIVVGAHYDAARLKDGSLSRGAVDNAASTVILVRLAETLQKEPPKAQVRLVFFDMEEIGLVGSRRYLAATGAERIAAMLNLDIAGVGDTIVYGSSTAERNRALRERLVVACALADIPCVGFPQTPPGDDRAFVGAGVPTLSLGILPAIQAHQLWLLLNARQEAGLATGFAPAITALIHSPADRSEIVEPAAMRRVYDLVLRLMRDLSGRPL